MTMTFEGRDLTIGDDGNLVIVTDLNAVLADAARAARTLLGEMVLAIDEGIPYFEVVWNGSPNLNQYQASLRDRILNVPGVLEVVSLSLGQSASTLDYEAVIRTIYGTGTVSNG